MRGWITPGHKHHTRWLELQERHGPEIEQRAVNNARTLMERIAQKEHEMLDALDAREIPARDRPGALRNLSTSKALQGDKVVLPFTGRDIASRQERSHEELVQALKNALTPHAVDAEAHVVETPELPPAA